MIWTVIELAILTIVLLVAEKPETTRFLKRVWRVLVEKIGDLFSFLPNTRKSNPISKLLRPVFESNRLKTVVGLNLAGMVLATGVSVIPGSAMGISSSELESGQWEDVQVATKQGVVQPVPEAKGISQGYHIFHLAIDIKAGLGAKVHPIAAGRVERVVRRNYGYGHWVLINHGEETKSLYAHLQEIVVEKGERVETSDQIGEVGLTGRTTGSHLHLEVYEHNKHVNPLVFLVDR